MFSVNGKQFGQAEVLAAAQRWGAWAALTTRTQQALACLAFAKAHGGLPDKATLRAAAAAFRYARQLLSADETQAWLTRQQVSVEEWLDYLRGEWLLEHWPSQGRESLAQLAATQPVAAAQLARASQVAAQCSGAFDEWTRELAGRAALAALSGLFEQRREAGTAALLAGIDAEFARQRVQLLTPPRLAAKIAEQRLDWLRYECRCLWFNEERSAREAVWCLTEDGLSLEAVAQIAGCAVQTPEFYLDESAAAWRPLLLAARPGEVLGPLADAAGFAVLVVDAKCAPSASDARLRARAEKMLLAQHLTQAIHERVVWEAGRAASERY